MTMREEARLGLAVVAAFTTTLAATTAHGEPAALPPLVLVGAHGGGGGAIQRAPSGFFVGADSGYSVLLAHGADEAHGALSFGARAGWQFASGLALGLRADDLGVNAPGSDASLLFTTAGVRYGLPLFVMPFAEVLVGPAFVGSHTTLGTGVGAGLSLPILRHVAIDLSARDWIADMDGSVRNVPTLQLGLAVGLGGHGH